MSKIITVFGATGAQGGGIVTALLTGSTFKVRAVTRNVTTDKAKQLKARGVEVVAGNVDEPDTVLAAMTGAYGCFFVTNFWDHMNVDKEVKQGKDAVDAAKKAGIKHFIYSGLESVKKLLGIPCPHFDGKATVEEYLQQSGLPFTSVRYSFYFENFSTIFTPYKVSDGKYVLNLPMGKVPMDGISVGDAGEVIHQIFLKEKEFIGKFVGLSGDKLTTDQYAAVFSKHLAPKKFSDGQMTLDQYRGLGFPGADDLGNMFEFYQRGNPVRDLSLCRKLHPKILSFDDWFLQNKKDMEKTVS